MASWRGLGGRRMTPRRAPRPSPRRGSRSSRPADDKVTVSVHRTGPPNYQRMALTPPFFQEAVPPPSLTREGVRVRECPLLPPHLSPLPLRGRGERRSEEGRVRDAHHDRLVM